MGAVQDDLITLAPRTARRAGSSVRSRLAAVVWCVLCAAPAAAQRPVPPDTLPSDTLPPRAERVAIPPEAVASDTLPGDSLMPAPPDSTRPAPALPGYPDPLPTGWAFARWELSRDEILRYRGLSLLDLLERFPGLQAIRSGGFGRPAGLAAAGLGGAAVRLFVNGYEIDPLGFPSHDLQRIGLIDLASLRVERTPAGVRVDLSTFRLPDARAYSEVEAAAGNYGTRVLRATLSRIVGSRNVFTAAYDLASTSGVALAEPYQARGGKVRWIHELSPRTGLALEFAQRGVERGGTAAPVDFTRRDLTLRARHELFAGLTIDGIVGRSRWSAETPPGTVLPDVRRTQGMLRALWMAGPADVEVSARIRAGDGGAAAPGTDLSARGVLRPLPWVTVEGEVSAATHAGATAALASAAARAGPFAGLSAFASVTAGDRWLALRRDTTITDELVVEDTVDGVPVTRTEERMRVEPAFSSILSSGSGARLGAEWTAGGAVVGAAALLRAPSTVAPFGVFFDRGIEPIAVGAARGVEGYASLPLPWTGRTIRLEGSASAWEETGGRPYLPVREARIALEYHDVRIEGQFEPTLRLEAVHRGETLVPNVEGTAFGYVAPDYTHLNLLLQIRVLDVRAFLIWENPTHNRLALDLPPGPGFQPGQRVVYGARWWFRN